jgi:hypothetical protein
MYEYTNNTFLRVLLYNFFSTKVPEVISVLIVAMENPGLQKIDFRNCIFFDIIGMNQQYSFFLVSILNKNKVKIDNFDHQKNIIS